MIEIIKTNDGYMVQHMDGELEGQYVCNEKGDNLFDRFAEAEDVLWKAFDKDQTLMNDSRALSYYIDKLAQHGWYAPVIFSIEDVKDHINGGTDIVDMPSDEILKRACAHVARKYPFDDYTDCIQWAAELTRDVNWETN